ncbi:MAG: polysaccharide deacetylase family protein [Pseudomonadota bacterium]
MKTSSLYSEKWNRELLVAEIKKNLGKALDGGRSARVFFRADDIGVPGKNLTGLLELFRRHEAPLCLALVPAWLTPDRWRALKKTAGGTGESWCWHQHGWRHVNHEAEGKKQEFGPSRDRDRQRHDLSAGKSRLSEICGPDFFPVFTPPWNRCSSITLELLVEFGYTAISRSREKTTPAPGGPPDYLVNVDLHTRKEKEPSLARENLFAELRESLAGGLCGIMIHHQGMNDPAFELLDVLLRELSLCPGIQFVDFRNLVRVQAGSGREEARSL